MYLVLYTLFYKSIKSGPMGPQVLRLCSRSSFLLQVMPHPVQPFDKDEVYCCIGFHHCLGLDNDTCHSSFYQPSGPIKPDSYIVYTVWLIDYSIGIVLSCCFV